MRDLIDEIAQVSEFMIGDILIAVIKRYAELFPDWEISTMSINKSCDRNEQLDRMISLLEKMKE